MMKKGTHGKDELSFAKLDYAGQSRTINAQIMVLEKSIKAHIRDSERLGKNRNESHVKCTGLIRNLLHKVEQAEE